MRNMVENKGFCFVKILHGKISSQPHTTLCIQFLDRENNDKNNTSPLGKQICFTIVWGCAEILPFTLLASIDFASIFVDLPDHLGHTNENLTLNFTQISLLFVKRNIIQFIIRNPGVLSF